MLRQDVGAYKMLRGGKSLVNLPNALPPKSPPVIARCGLETSVVILGSAKPKMKSLR